MSPQRLVRESNPSHFMDSEAATPVASRSKLSKSRPLGSRESNLIASLRSRQAQVRDPNASPPPSAGGVAYGDRTRLRRFTVDPRPRRETPPQQLGAERAREHAAPVDCRGVAPPRSSGFQPDAITGLAHNPKPQTPSALGGTRTLHRLGESQTSCLLEDESVAPAGGIEPPRVRLTTGCSTAELRRKNGKEWSLWAESHCRGLGS
jgi:hypothetical protein